LIKAPNLNVYIYLFIYSLLFDSDDLVTDSRSSTQLQFVFMFVFWS